MDVVFDLNTSLLAIIAGTHGPGKYSPFFKCEYDRKWNCLTLWVGQWEMSVELLPRRTRRLVHERAMREAGGA